MTSSRDEIGSTRREMANYGNAHVDLVVKQAVAAERERCAKIVRRICGESAHVKLGDAIEIAIFNLKE